MNNIKSKLNEIDMKYWY